jgi:hypothetical protein
VGYMDEEEGLGKGQRMDGGRRERGSGPELCQEDPCVAHIESQPTHHPSLCDTVLPSQHACSRQTIKRPAALYYCDGPGGTTTMVEGVSIRRTRRRSKRSQASEPGTMGMGHI